MRVLKFDNRADANFADFEQGREDGGQTNPYFTPGDRTARALDAYNEGYYFACECMADYLDQQED